jgi:hypothetical protein
MADEEPAHAAYIFSPDASYALVSDLRHSGLPRGVHLVASVTGPWQIFAIAEFDDLTELPAIIESLFGGGRGGGGRGSTDPPTAFALGRNSIKKSVYADEMALVRLDVAGVEPDGLQDLLGAIGEETNAVFGDFDILTCVAADDVDGVMARIFELRGMDAVVRTTTLWIIDYVCAGEDAPKAYRRRPRSD